MKMKLATGFAALTIVAPALIACSTEDSDAAEKSSTVAATTTIAAVSSSTTASTTEISEFETSGPAVTPAPPAQSAAEPEATTAAAQDESDARELCGNSDTGLAVWAANTDCATAMGVQSAFHAARASSATSTLTVTVDGRDWSCQELQGEINPYLECSDGSGTVRLTS